MIGKVDIYIKRGARYAADYTWCNPIPGTDPPQPDLNNPIDLTGYHARWAARTDPSPYYDGDTFFTYTDADPNIVLGGVAGTVHTEILASETWLFQWRTAYHDLKMIPPTGEDDAVYVFSGRVTVEPSVTQ